MIVLQLITYSVLNSLRTFAILQAIRYVICNIPTGALSFLALVNTLNLISIAISYISPKQHLLSKTKFGLKFGDFIRLPIIEYPPLIVNFNAVLFCYVDYRSNNLICSLLMFQTNSACLYLLSYRLRLSVYIIYYIRISMLLTACILTIFRHYLVIDNLSRD